jgi:hypothetical protein
VQIRASDRYNGQTPYSGQVQNIKDGQGPKLRTYNDLVRGIDVNGETTSQVSHCPLKWRCMAIAAVNPGGPYADRLHSKPTRRFCVMRTEAEAM